jgi:exonuclease SbcC
VIPIRLELLNFLCYRQPKPLDLDGISIACLAGSNGAGKSSLLDAMTWALWGRARARRDDELIHLGQEEMQVEFTFDLEGNRYRVLRQRLAGKRGRSVLELQISDGDENFRSISENTIRETQNKINRILRLDYDTFVNSAFLLQGRADEFTVKTAGERKQILSDILGLSQWEQFEEQAKARIKVTDQRLAVLTARLEEIDRELALEGQYRDDVAAAQAEVLRLSEKLHQAEAQLREVQAARQDLSHKQQQREDLTRRLAQRERELATVGQELTQAQTRAAAYERILDQSSEIEAGYQRWSKAREMDATFNTLLSQQNALLERRATLEGALAEARSKLVAEQSALKQRLTELERRAAGKAVAGELKDTRAELQEMAERESERDALQARLTALGEEAGESRARNEALKAKGDDLNDRLDQLRNVAEARCPLCGQELSETHRNDLLQQLEAELVEMRAEWKKNRERVQQVSEEVDQARSQLDVVAKVLKQLPTLQRREAELAQRMIDAEQATAQMAEVQSELSAVETRLQNNDYVPELRNRLGTLQAELDGLGYDKRAHQEVREALVAHGSFEARYTELTQAQAEIEGAREAVTRLGGRQERWEKEWRQDQAVCAALEQEIQQLNSQLVDAPEVEERTAALRRQESMARERMGAVQQRLAACQALKSQREEFQAELTQRGEERTIYDELRVAFGKKGVPAMIIEATIPEIENTANSLLNRMTDGRMHVRFETQREKVTGGVAETLDIQISDELGTRSYEMYSGGEAFRINFAIRIALSQLLARRAGARLSTLVIDEGFGTQDARGRERLVEAINVIQKEFERILVITHIDELKDAFPARIEITKTPLGSQIEVS